MTATPGQPNERPRRTAGARAGSGAPGSGPTSLAETRRRARRHPAPGPSGDSFGDSFDEIVALGDRAGWIGRVAVPTADLLARTTRVASGAALPVSDDVLADWCRTAAPAQLGQLRLRGNLPPQVREILIARHPPAALDAALRGDPDGLARLQRTSKQALNAALRACAWPPRDECAGDTAAAAALLVARRASLAELVGLPAHVRHDPAVASIVAGRVRGTNLSAHPERRVQALDAVWQLGARRWPAAVRSALAGWLAAHANDAAASTRHDPDPPRHLADDWYSLAVDAAADRPASRVVGDGISSETLNLACCAYAAAVESGDRRRVASWEAVLAAMLPYSRGVLSSGHVDLGAFAAAPLDMLAGAAAYADGDLLGELLARRPLTDEAGYADAVLAAVAKISWQTAALYQRLDEPWRSRALRNPDYAAAVLQAGLIADPGEALDLPAAVALEHFGDPPALLDAIGAEVGYDPAAFAVLRTLPVTGETTLRAYCRAARAVAATNPAGPHTPRTAGATPA
jgi:hypothetical protein